MSPNDGIRDGIAVELEPNNAIGRLMLLIEQRQSAKQWLVRKLTNLAGAVAGLVSGWLLEHGGQNYAQGIAVGIVAAVMFFGEWIWSWLLLKFTHRKVVQAAVAVAKTTAVMLFFALTMASCMTAHAAPPSAYTPETRPLVVGESVTPPAWEVEAINAYRFQLAKRYRHVR